MMEVMDKEYKKALLLLKTMIFYYHGLDEGEKNLLQKYAAEMDAREELEWALDYVSSDSATAFSRIKSYLTQYVSEKPKSDKIDLLKKAWEATKEKGHITEIEATAILKLSKEWNVESDFVKMIRQ